MNSSIAFTANIATTTSRMWLAYAIAPSAAPVIFVVLVLLAGFAGMIVNPGGVLLLPRIFVLGLLASYTVAGVLGMPIAFLLRRVGYLNGLTIHAAALAWAFAFSVLVAEYFSVRSGGNVPAMIVAVFMYDVMPILSSALAFWTIVGFDGFANRRLN